MRRTDRPMPLDPDSPRLPLDPDSPALPLHLTPWALAFVFVGGALGTGARYALSKLLPVGPREFPLGTFAANVVGAFVIGVLLEALVRAGSDEGWRRRLRLLVGTGFCGGLTTYSTFAVESDLLVHHGSVGVAAGYAAATVVAGLVACFGGVALAARRSRS